MIRKTLAGILLGANLIFNSCENYEKPQTKTTQKTQESPEDTLLKTAGNFYYSGDYELAKKTYSNFLEIKTQKNDSLGIAKAFQNIGMVFEAQGNYNKVSEYYINSLKIYENLKDSSRISNIYRGLGSLFYAQKKYEKALEYFDKSLYIKKVLNDSLGVSQVLNNIGAIFDEQNKNEMALINYFNSLKIANKIKNKSQESLCLNNIAAAYRKKKDLYEAFKYYYKAIEINKELENKEGLATNFINISDLYLEKENYPKALENLKKADTLSKEIGNPSLSKDIYETFSQIYEAKKDYKKSLEYHVLFSQIKDTLINEKSLKQVAELSTIYETEKKEQENNLLKKDNQIIEEKSQKQKWGLLGLAGIVTLLAGGGALLYKSRKKIHKAKKIIEEKNKEITDSMNYARNIQRAILPSELEAKKHLEEHFIFYKPKDVISGDFYWIAEKNNKTYFAACDCTGHGVPGAFISVLNSGLLNNAVNEKQIEKPNEIFNYVRNEIINSLKSKGESGEQKDGMDAVLCSWDKKTNTLEFACANNPLFLVRDNKINDFKEDRMPVGYQDELKQFKNNAIELKKNDVIYIFSDGYQSQFGGPQGKKFMKKNLRELLLSISQKPMDEQKEILNKTINDWMAYINPEDKKTYEQTDDLCVIGLRI